MELSPEEMQLLREYKRLTRLEKKLVRDYLRSLLFLVVFSKGSQRLKSLSEQAASQEVN